MFISLVINIFMMITWSAKMSITDLLPLISWPPGYYLPSQIFEYGDDMLSMIENTIQVFGIVGHEGNA